MSRWSSTQWRQPEAEDLHRCRELLLRRPAPHLYLISRLERALAGGREDGCLLLRGEEELAFLGDEGNLAMSELSAPGREALVDLVRRRYRGLGILVSPLAEVEALARGLAGETSLHLFRRQALYAARAPWQPARAATLQVPRQEEVPQLLEMALNLAVEDLELPRRRLSRRRMEATVKKRLRQGRTFILHHEGEVAFKVDLAVRTGAGVLVEGVYTFPGKRRLGLAAAGMRACLDLLLTEYPLVGLHVGQANRPARRAYEKAGMELAGELGLAIFTPWR